MAPVELRAVAAMGLLRTSTAAAVFRSARFSSGTASSPPVGRGRCCALIVGAPGSGKGTISNWIVRDFGFSHLSSGDILRQHIKDGTAVGLKAKAFIDRGDLVPDETMVQLIASQLLQGGNASSWLLDGFPRTRPQAEALQAQTPVDLVINLDVPFQTIIDRIKGAFLTLQSSFFSMFRFKPFYFRLFLAFGRSMGTPRIRQDLQHHLQPTQGSGQRRRDR